MTVVNILARVLLAFETDDLITSACLTFSTIIAARPMPLRLGRCSHHLGSSNSISTNSGEASPCKSCSYAQVFVISELAFLIKKKCHELFLHRVFSHLVGFPPLPPPPSPPFTPIDPLIVTAVTIIIHALHCHFPLILFIAAYNGVNVIYI